MLPVKNKQLENLSKHEYLIMRLKDCQSGNFKDPFIDIIDLIIFLQYLHNHDLFTDNSYTILAK
jgi:hypothetical protein